MATPGSSVGDRRLKESPESRLSGFSPRQPSSEPPRLRSTPPSGRRATTTALHVPGVDFDADKAAAAVASELFARHLEDHVVAMEEVTRARQALNSALRVSSYSPPPPTGSKALYSCPHLPALFPNQAKRSTQANQKNMFSSNIFPPPLHNNTQEEKEALVVYASATPGDKASAAANGGTAHVAATAAVATATAAVVIASGIFNSVTAIGNRIDKDEHNLKYQVSNFLAILFVSCTWNPERNKSKNETCEGSLPPH